MIINYEKNEITFMHDLQKNPDRYSPKMSPVAWTESRNSLSKVDRRIARAASNMTLRSRFRWWLHGPWNPGTRRAAAWVMTHHRGTRAPNPCLLFSITGDLVQLKRLRGRTRHSTGKTAFAERWATSDQYSSHDRTCLILLEVRGIISRCNGPTVRSLSAFVDKR